MQNKILKQRRLFITRECEFAEHGLIYRVNSLKNGSEVTVPYEDIYPQRLLKQQETSWIPLILTPIMTIVLFVNFVALLLKDDTEFTYGALTILFLFTIIMGFSAYVGRRREILIPAANKQSLQQFVILFENSPNKETVTEFIEELSVQINRYIKEKYGNIDHDFPIEPQLQNLVWLKDRNAITNEEFEDLKNRALGRVSNNNVIGFKRT
ncbi:hypothetical protein [Pedobacter boryungensis]|uniref:SHOCT domain-containing protein n=1 Tax=Pedobacter boryungensis TaxID=869962 RepID=A0ABX2DDV6_9SPHI|nr:hypothetical protein [Pedobacter boryungensis]NQX32002.1 hypothetical protein [Pedobacter boryungensis]